MFTSLIFLLAVRLAAVTALPDSLRLLTTFSQIVNELDNISLGNCSMAGADLPLNNTKVELPHPSSNLTLKYIALGRGTQNYTCPSTSATSRNVSTPTATGAAAMLFDASCLASTSMTLLHEVPAIIGRAPLASLPFMAEVLGATTSTPNLILGEHYFDANGDPFFNLRMSGSDAWMSAKKNASVSAPAREYSSDTERKDVAWLQLESKKGNGIKVIMSRIMSSSFYADSSTGSLSCHDL